MLSTLLDPRTVNCFHLKNRQELVYTCINMLSEEYVRYGMLYNETAAKKKAMLAAKVDTDTAAVLAKITSSYGSTPAPSSGVTAAVSAVIPKKSERTFFTEDSSDEETPVEEVNAVAAAKALVEAKAAEVLALKGKLKTDFERVFKAYRKAALATLPFLTNTLQ